MVLSFGTGNQRYATNVLNKLSKRLLAPIQIPPYLLLLFVLLQEIPAADHAIRFWANAIVEYAPYLGGICRFLLSAPGQWTIICLSLTWIAIVAWRKDRRSPHFSYQEQSGGLYDLLPNRIGFYLVIKNDETRYQTTAHHINATIRYKHSLGNEMVINGVWMNAHNAPRRFMENASMGMNEAHCLLILIWDSDSPPAFYAPEQPIPPQLNPARYLEFGEWKIEMKLRGDNFKDTYNGVLTLVPNRAPTLRRI